MIYCNPLSLGTIESSSFYTRISRDRIMSNLSITHLGHGSIIIFGMD